MKMTLGLQPEHIKKIELEIALWDSSIEEDDNILKPGWVKYEKFFWDKMGREIG